MALTDGNVIAFVALTGLILGSLLFPLYDYSKWLPPVYDILTAWLYLISFLLIGIQLVGIFLYRFAYDPRFLLFKLTLALFTLLQVISCFPLLMDFYLYHRFMQRSIRGCLMGALLVLMTFLTKNSVVPDKTVKLAFGLSTAAGFLVILTFYLIWFYAVGGRDGYEEIVCTAQWVLSLALFAVAGLLMKRDVGGPKIALEESATKCLTYGV